MSVGSIPILSQYFTNVKGFFSNLPKWGRRTTLTSQPNGLDETDRRIVEFVRQFHVTHKHGPSLDEVGEQVGMTRQGARWRVNQLVQAGWLTRKGRRPRTLRVIKTV